MAHIFISYAHTDREYARKLADHLLANGFDVWIDDRINFGANWIREIFRAIDTADAFILIMSTDSEKSDWVQKEYLQADARKKHPFPCLLNGEVFPYFRSVQYYDVKGDKLPSKAFLEDLGKFAQRSTTSGQDVASPPQQAIEREIKHSTQPEMTGTYLTEQRDEVKESSARIPRYKPREDKLATPAITRRLPRRLPLAFVAGTVVIAVATAMILFVRTISSIDATSTPTLTASVSVSRGSSRSAGLSDAPTGATISGTPVSLTPSEEPMLVDPLAQAWLEQTQTAEVLTKTAAFGQARTSVAQTSTALAPTPSGGGQGQIAFRSDRNGNNELYLMDSSGGTPQQITSDPNEDSGPAWSPDGSQLAFRSDRTGSNEIYLMNADRSNERRITRGGANNYSPSWSPDGKKLAFESDRNGSLQIFIISVEGSDIHLLTDQILNDHDPSWSPDGTQIAFDSEQGSKYEIYVMNADGSNPRHLTDNSSDARFPAWSPDGSRIAFASNRDGNYEIYMMNTDGSNAIRLTTHAGDDKFPVWSPDGTQIAFYSNRDNDSEIYVMNADGSNQHNISNSPTNELYPAWRP